MKRVLAIAVFLLAGAASAQPFGPGTMGGWGPDSYGRGGYGMGGGMMRGFAADAYAGLDLTAEQRTQIATIEQETSQAIWQQMGTMHGQGWRMNGMFGAGPLDEDAARKTFQAMADARKVMFETQLQARKRI